MTYSSLSHSPRWTGTMETILALLLMATLALLVYVARHCPEPRPRLNAAPRHVQLRAQDETLPLTESSPGDYAASTHSTQ